MGSPHRPNGPTQKKKAACAFGRLCNLQWNCQSQFNCNGLLIFPSVIRISFYLMMNDAFFPTKFYRNLCCPTRLRLGCWASPTRERPGGNHPPHLVASPHTGYR